jgi:hypothetical protein
LSQQIIEVVVATDGKVTVQTKGFTGSACKAASESLEKALGLKQSEKLTAEFYSQQTNQQQLQEGQQ